MKKFNESLLIRIERDNSVVEEIGMPLEALMNRYNSTEIIYCSRILYNVGGIHSEDYYSKLYLF